MITQQSARQLDLFIDSLPRKPSCADDLQYGTVIRSIPHALLKKYIQHNRPGLVRWIVFDIDRPFSWAARDAGTDGLPVPAWVAWNAESRHAHVAYGLTAPVPTTSAAKPKPMRYLAAVEQAYCEKLDADPRYTNRLTKNPSHSAWDVWLPNTAGTGVYDLGTLARCVDLTPSIVHAPANDPEISRGFGRNVTLFDTLRHWSYVAIRQGWPAFERWHDAVIQRAEGINAQFADPLPWSEVKATAKSVAKWTHQHFSPESLQDLIDRTHRPEKQAERGRMSGEARRKASEDKRPSAILMAATGMKQADIAAELDVSQPTVHRWLKSCTW